MTHANSLYGALTDNFDVNPLSVKGYSIKLVYKQGFIQNCRCLLAALALPTYLFTILAIFSPESIAADKQAQQFPLSSWQDMADPLASADAVPGGLLTVAANQYPKSFNYYLDNNSFTAMVFGVMYESLLMRHPVTLQEEPFLAAKWSISADKKVYTFWLDKRARWSDGKAITAYDVKFTFDTILNPKNLTGSFKVGLENFLTPKVINDQEIEFTAKKVHWRNLNTLGGINIMPKHVFEGKDFNKINFTFPVISGPYAIDHIKEGVSLRIKRREDWWAGEKGANFKRVAGKYNFDTIVYKFFKARNNAFEAFKKGTIDLFAVYQSSRWTKEAAGKKFDKNWIVKQKIYNSNPRGFQGFAMNARRDNFSDPLVRKALCHLLNRNKMNANLMFNAYSLLASYFPDLYGEAIPTPNALVEFDKKQARELLKKAGWVVNKKTGKLEKAGKTFVINFLTRSASSVKFLNIYKEDLADVGIELTIDKKDWAAWAKDMDEYNYDMTWAAWGASVFKDPEGMWESTEVDRKSGVNITGFADKQVDELIGSLGGIFDVNKRHEICRQIDQKVFDAHPYALLWGIDYVRLLYWNKFATPKTVLSKYSDDEAACWYWWLDEDSQADLDDAQKSGEALPAQPAVIHFEKLYK